MQSADLWHMTTLLASLTLGCMKPSTVFCRSHPMLSLWACGYFWEALESADWRASACRIRDVSVRAVRPETTRQPACKQCPQFVRDTITAVTDLICITVGTRNVIDQHIDYCLLKKRDVPRQQLRQLNNRVLLWIVSDPSGENLYKYTRMSEGKQCSWRPSC